MLTNEKFADRPLGMQDVFPNYARLRRQLENQILQFFENASCEMVSSGAFEYVDTLLRARPTEAAETWVQLFDASGRAIAVRPDMTPSIARMAAPLVANGQSPLKWCYAERVYHRTADPASLSWASGKAAESSQVGVEWIGTEASSQVDCDILALCQQAMASVHGIEFQMVVSHARFAPAYLRAKGVPDQHINQLLHLLAEGNYVGFRDVLLNNHRQDDILSELMSFDPFAPSTFESEARTTVAGTAAGSAAICAWNELVELARALSNRSLHAHVSFDLSLFRDVSYYTGVVFEVFSPGVGAPIALGGRYDDLLAQFGAPAPAIGFTFEIERVLAVLSDGAWLFGNGSEVFQGC